MKRMRLFIPLILMLGVFQQATAQNSDFLLDGRDGNIYLVAKFNTFWWMCQNLKYDIGEGSACIDNDETNCMLNGRLYNWEAAKKACPEGYHLPSDEEWKALESYVGMKDDDLDKNYNRVSGTVGKFLKQGGGISFDANYVGMINDQGQELFSNLKACFWTASVNGDGYSWSRLIDKTQDGVDRLPNQNKFMLSVRCVKEADPEEVNTEESKEETPD